MGLKKSFLSYKWLTQAINGIPLSEIVNQVLIIKYSLMVLILIEKLFNNQSNLNNKVTEEIFIDKKGKEWLC